MNIIKPPLDKAQYKHTTIKENGLEVVLIYDKDADVSAASMTVNTGYYDDPDGFPGLAHFLEHMLFMGTKKYPDVNHYNEFLNNHGGSSNAHTADQFTSYYFDVQSEHITKTLDIFAQFFIHPLFDSKTVSKEMQAVDSEHSKNILSDSWRLNRIVKKMANKAHPFSKFSTGNLDTLKHPNIRETLIKFYQNHYSADKMKLCVVSNISIDDLLPQVIQMFSKVKRNKVNPPPKLDRTFLMKDTPPSKSVAYKLIKIVPVQDEDNLIILWPLPSTRTLYRIKPIVVISLLLGHESGGGIINYLRKKRLATNLGCSKYESDDNMTILMVSVELTEEGFKQVPTVVDTVYMYINKILEDQRSLKRFYIENAQTNRVEFEYKPKVQSINQALSVSENMTFYPIKYCLSVDYIFDKYNQSTKNQINKYLKMVRRERSLIVISSKKYSKIARKKEKYYGIQYLEITYPTGYDGGFKPAQPIEGEHLNLPKPNPNVPRNIKLFPKSKPAQKYPLKLISSSSTNRNHQLWYMKDDQYSNPKIMVVSNVYNKDLSSSVQNYVLVNMYIAIVDYLLTSFNYYARLAGTVSSTQIGYETLIFETTAYNNNITQVLQNSIHIFTKLGSQPHPRLLRILSIVKRAYQDRLKNYIYNPPHKLALHYLKEKAYNRYYTYKDQLKALESLRTNKNTLNKLLRTIDLLKNRSVVRSFIGGNVSKDTAKNLSRYFDFFAHKGGNPPLEMPIIKVSQLKPGQNETYKRPTYNPQEVDSALVLYYEIGSLKKGVTPDWNRRLILLNLVDRFISEKFFHQLRSIEQSGYIVKSSIFTIGSLEDRVQGYAFTIQSYKKGVDMLQERVLKFVEESYQKLLQITDKQFKTYQDITVTMLQEKDKNMYEHFSFMVGEIRMGDYMFNVKDKLVATVKSLTKSDLVQYFKNHFIDKQTKKTRTVKICAKGKKIDKNSNNV